MIFANFVRLGFLSSQLNVMRHKQEVKEPDSVDASVVSESSVCLSLFLPSCHSFHDTRLPSFFSLSPSSLPSFHLFLSLRLIPLNSLERESEWYKRPYNEKVIIISDEIHRWVRLRDIKLMFKIMTRVEWNWRHLWINFVKIILSIRSMKLCSSRHNTELIKMIQRNTGSIAKKCYVRYTVLNIAFHSTFKKFSSDSLWVIIKKGNSSIKKNEIHCFVKSWKVIENDNVLNASQELLS